MAGKVGTIPPPGNGVDTRGIDWARIVALLRKHEGQPMRFEELTDLDNVRSVYQTIKQRSHRDLRLDGYRVVGNVRNSRPDDDNPNRRRGDIWVTLVKE